MFTQAELMDGIHELLEGKKSIQNCEKLAAVYTVLDHLYPADSIPTGYSGSSEVKADYIPKYGDTDFLIAISGKNPADMWMLMDDLMTALFAINPRLYDSVMQKI